ncbi:hypothetical protein [Streptomyces zagrosensis]|uniref:Pimeloyl-ACP methyl ester carboxylesterase n=1 Tax=Streptomyces zagrosensis TaxID=1042984 RepID=A0A7W9V0L6_9ACTN|nr:hypothetical protein [Streptomyces zagrosensis]MBB5938313.1 pimeloyl-ACP methyl ester carboxylesterase [Streptomyces zagrosensis]
MTAPSLAALGMGRVPGTRRRGRLRRWRGSSHTRLVCPSRITTFFVCEEYPGAGHGLFITHAERINQELLGFIEDISTRAE